MMHFLGKHSSLNNFPKRVWPKDNVYATWLFSKNPIRKLLTLQPAEILILQAPKEISYNLNNIKQTYHNKHKAWNCI